MAIEIVSFPINNGDFPLLCKRSPEGTPFSENPHIQNVRPFAKTPSQGPGHAILVRQMCSAKILRHLLVIAGPQSPLDILDPGVAGATIPNKGEIISNKYG